MLYAFKTWCPQMWSGEGSFLEWHVPIEVVVTVTIRRVCFRKDRIASLLDAQDRIGELYPSALCGAQIDVGRLMCLRPRQVPEYASPNFSHRRIDPSSVPEDRWHVLHESVLSQNASPYCVFCCQAPCLPGAISTRCFVVADRGATNQGFAKNLTETQQNTPENIRYIVALRGALCNRFLRLLNKSGNHCSAFISSSNAA